MASRFEWSPTAHDDIMRAGWDAWVDANRGPVRTTVQAESPVDKGGLKGGHNVEMVAGGPAGTRIMRVVASASYGDPVALGSRPHEIRAKPGGVLAFLDRAGNRRFAKKVNHPGTRATWWMCKALEKAGLRTVRAPANPGSP